jgi:glycosyltransferase involved in cell wall biosynthesis
MTVAAFTGGMRYSSPRFRLRQYIPHLRPFGVEVSEFAARLGSWPPRPALLRPFWGIGTLLQRLPAVLASHRYDLTFLQREMLATFVTLEPFTRRPRVLDLDDALWLHGRGECIRRLAGLCHGVLCGNAFLADNVRRWNPNVRILPTAVDTDRYCPAPRNGSGNCIIGWSGLSSGFKYLLEIEPALCEVLRRKRQATLRVVSDRRPSFGLIPASQVEFIPWSPRREVSAIREMTVGLMPLDGSPWCLGKCSYKMLLYMSCEVPVVVSPVGMNGEVLALGKAGLAPESPSDWVDALEWLLTNPGKARDMGKTGREVVRHHYSLEVIAPRLAQYLREFAA